MTTKRYMLDTNTVSALIKGNTHVEKHLAKIPMENICISSITEAELLFGLEKKPGAVQLKRIVHEFLIRVDILAWDSHAAKAYAKLRASCVAHGTLLGNLDMLIAAHAISISANLVTQDQAFYKVKPKLLCVDWLK